MTFNLATILRESAQAAPGKAAVILGPSRLSYGELDELSRRFAAALRTRGLGRGDVVAVILPNIPQFLVAYFGILQAGCVMVPLNVLLRAPEIEYALRDSGARAVIVWDGVAAEAARAAEAVGGVPTWVVATGAAERPAGTFDSLELLSVEPLAEMVQTAAEDVAVILYTSGTTGHPKGAELTHFQLYMNCDVAGRLFGVLPDDVALAALPLFHVFGLSSVCNVAVRAGGTLALVPRFEAGAVLEVMERERVSIFSGVPTMFIALLAHPDVDTRDLSALRVANSGGASIPGEVLRQFESRFGVRVLEGYGLSETASAASFNRPEASRVDSVGLPMWGVEMRVVDENDQPLPRGRTNVGEIVIRGHNVMRGYHGQPQATAEAMRGGWFHTGDLAYVDDEGFFFIVDRKKELIIRGGYNVYPREVEEVLYAHPAVAEAAVIGRPDPRLGEEVAAVVALRPGMTTTAEELIAFARERVAAYKYPRTVQFLDALPKGPTGKVLKRQLAAEVAAAHAPASHPTPSTPGPSGS